MPAVNSREVIKRNKNRYNFPKRTCVMRETGIPLLLFHIFISNGDKLFISFSGGFDLSRVYVDIDN